MKSRKLSFTNRKEQRLSAILDEPDANVPGASALFAHCFTCSKDLKSIQNINHALTHRNIAVLRFDFTGLGESEGDFSDSHFSSNVRDLIDASRFMEKTLRAPSILIGHSLGGAAVLQAAASLPSVKAVITIGAPSRPDHVTNLLVSSMEEIERKGEAEIVLAGRQFTVTSEFLEDLEVHRMQDTIRKLGRPLLILHSPIDKIVGIENAAQIFQEAKHPKSFVSLDTADHLLLNPENSTYAGSLIAAWVYRYIEAA